MKLFVCAFLVAQAVLQISNAQVIRTIGGPILSPLGLDPCNPLCCQPSPVILQNNNVAASLADTLSLLTVSSLLADTLPLGANVIGLPVGCGYNCGCGNICGSGCGSVCGCGCGGLGCGGLGCGGLGCGGLSCYY